MNIGMVVFEGFTDLDFYMPWDILNRVRLLKLCEDWTVQILAQSNEIKSAAGLTRRATNELAFANECEAVFFCSGDETRKLIQDESFLSKFHLDESRQVIAAIDSGALILGALGLLRGNRATTYPTAAEALSLFCEVLKEPFVESGQIATAARCLSGDKIALWMITKLLGKDVSEKVYEAIRPLR